MSPRSGSDPWPDPSGALKHEPRPGPTVGALFETASHRRPQQGEARRASQRGARVKSLEDEVVLLDARANADQLTAVLACRRVALAVAVAIGQLLTGVELRAL